MEHNQRIFLLHSLLNSIVSVRVEDVERLPKTGGVLLVCNHSDLIDPVIQGLYSGRDLCYLAKAELLDGNPLRRFQRYVDKARRQGVPEILLGFLNEILEILGQLLRDARILPIVRGYRSGTASGSFEYYEALMRDVVKLLGEGEAVAMYPEGGRSFDGKLKPFRGLAARIALQAGVPIVPTAIVGAYGFSDLNRWVSDRRRSRSRSIVYRIGEPIDPRKYMSSSRNATDDNAETDWRAVRDKEAIKTLTHDLHTAVAGLLEFRPRRPRKNRPGTAPTASQKSGQKKADKKTDQGRSRPVKRKTRSKKSGA